MAEANRNTNCSPDASGTNHRPKLPESAVRLRRRSRPHRSERDRSRGDRGARSKNRRVLRFRSGQDRNASPERPNQQGEDTGLRSDAGRQTPPRGRERPVSPGSMRPPKLVGSEPAHQCERKQARREALRADRRTSKSPAKRGRARARNLSPAGMTLPG